MKFFIKHLLNTAVLLLLVLTVFDLGLHGVFPVLASDEVSAKISSAEDALQLTFVAVLDAENAGANISGLLIKLDLAGQNLTRAEKAYESGRFSEALIEAERCSFLAAVVAGEAAGLKNSVLSNVRIAGWQMYALSGVGAFVLATFLVLGWVLFKRRYALKLVEMKPEACSDVEA